MEKSSNGSIPVITLPGATHLQTITGRPSPLFPNSIQEFRGIPYGRVPGRWRHSTLRTQLPSDHYDATKNGPQCPQPSMFANSKTYQSHLDWPTDVTDDEYHCLNLFVIRPSPEALQRAGLGGDIKLPVYVNIHGGGFGFGAGSDPMWDPTRLVQRSLERCTPFIGVNVNYRLGIFGFGISSDLLDVQSIHNELKGGNFGIGDQRVALRWISQNISAFGGDASKITIAGQSAGGVSTQLHVFEAKFGSQQPLFRRAIQQSGGIKTMGPNGMDIANEKWQSLYAKLGITGKTSTERMEPLFKMSQSKLLATAVSNQWLMFPPVRDGMTISDKTSDTWFVNFGKHENRPKKAQGDKDKPIAVLIGDCEEEGFYKEQIQSFANLAALETFLKSKSVAVSSQGWHELLDTYDVSAATPKSQFHNRIEQIMTDMTFGYPIEMARREISAARVDHGNVIEGSASYPSETRSFRIKFGNPFPGPCHNIAHHCVDLLYIYDCFHDHMRRIDKEEASAVSQKLHPNGWASNASLVESIQNLWINFITNDEVPGSESVAYIYDVDRKLYLREMAKEEEWINRRARLDVIVKNHDLVRSLADAFPAMVKFD